MAGKSKDLIKTPFFKLFSPLRVTVFPGSEIPGTVMPGKKIKINRCESTILNDSDLKQTLQSAESVLYRPNRCVAELTAKIFAGDHPVKGLLSEQDLLRLSWVRFP